MKTEKLPAIVLSFSGDLEVGNNGDGAKTAPLRMVARSGDAVDVPGYGRVVHDFASMHHKSRIPVDYNHDRSEVIGYLNHFDVEGGDLKCAGALVPNKGDSDRASEVIYKSHAGVPYEASITFTGHEGRIRGERVPANKTVQVNGREFTGPLTVVRDWSLRGVAVCPYGMDANTVSAAMSATGFVEMEIEEIEMSENTSVETEQVVETVESVEDAVTEVTESVEANVVEESSEAEQVVDESPAEMSLGQRFLDEFGDQGGVWFAQGMSLGDARREYTNALKLKVDELTKSNEALQTEIVELRDGDGVEFNARDQNQKSDGRKTAARFGVENGTGHLADAFARRSAQKNSM